MRSSTKEMHEFIVETETARTSAKKYFPQFLGTDRKLFRNSTHFVSIFLHSPSDSFSVGDGSDLYANAVLLIDWAKSAPDFSRLIKKAL